jgi:hypothetical protein
MKRIFDKELAEPVPPDDLVSSKPCWYLPHFGVYHTQNPEKISVATVTSGDNFRSRDSRTRGNIIENIHIFFFCDKNGRHIVHIVSA